MQPPIPPAPRGALHAPLRGLPALLLLLLLLCVLGTAPQAHASDACDDCPLPSAAALAEAVAGKLERRGPFNGASDHVEVDKGACIVTMTSAPIVTPKLKWLVLRASGEVWNCPHSKSSDTVTARASHSDSTEWTVRAGGGFKLQAVVAEVKAELEAGHTRGETIVEVTEVSKTISATWCRRIPWEAYFVVGNFEAVAEFSIKQHWAWWTKNVNTGSTVHAKGSIYVDCGMASITFERNAPLAGHFYLTQRGCDDEGCGPIQQKVIGFFPPVDGPLPGASGPEDPAPPAPEASSEGSGTPSDEPGEEPPEEEPGLPTLPESSAELGEPPGGPVPDPMAEEGE